MADSVIDPPAERRGRFNWKVSAVWLVMLIAAFVLLRSLRRGLPADDAAALVSGVFLLGSGLATAVVFLHQWFRGAGTSVFAFLLGAIVAATAGLILSVLILMTPLDFLVRGGGVFDGFMILAMPVLGAFFGGVGGVAAAIVPDTYTGRLKALVTGGGVPIGIVAVPSCLDGGRSDFVWSGVTVLIGILGTFAGLWLVSNRGTTSTAISTTQR